MNGVTPKPSLLLIDDEERILRSLSMLFRGHYDLLATTDPGEALRHVATQAVHVVVSDQRMPQMRGAELLRRVRELSPNTMRVLLTGYSELDAVVASVNEGEIFRFINKPWDAQQLRATVRQAADISLALRGAGEPASAPLPTARVSLSGTGDNGLVATDTETILVIDDDLAIANAVRDIAGPQQTVLWARTLDQAMNLIEQHAIAVLVSELAISGESVAPLLKMLKAEHPQIVTLVLTPFQDVSVFVGLINQGQVYRLLPKPLRRGAFGMSIASALRHHRMLRSTPALHAAHRVEPAAPTRDEAGIGARVMGMLSRLRSRAQPAA